MSKCPVNRLEKEEKVQESQHLEDKYYSLIFIDIFHPPKASTSECCDTFLWLNELAVH